MIVDRVGQQSGLLSNAFANVTPFAASSDCTLGMYSSESHRWSSVRINTTFCGCGSAWTSGPAAPTNAATTSTTAAIRTLRMETPRGALSDAGPDRR